MHQEPLSANSRTDASKPPDFVIRAAVPSDLPDFFELATVAGAGFTSLPINEALLAERLEGSKRAFFGENGTLMLALEDLDASRVIGCAAIKIGGKVRSDFLNFLVDDDQESLLPTPLYSELTEVGSLLVHPDYRQFGVGRWLAQSRYLLIAGDIPRFGDHLFSELRGIINDNHHSPFYDGVLAAYFKMSYQEADYLCTHGRQAELNAMLPSSPISTDRIGEAAEASIGRPHQDGMKALWFLEDEGFRFEGAIDLLDGGPLVSAPSRYVKTIQSSFLTKIAPGSVDQSDAKSAMLAIGDGAAFRSVKGWIIERDDHVMVSPDLMKRANIGTDAVVRCSKEREKQPVRMAATAETELCNS